jgi:hypothetical protein
MLDGIQPEDVAQYADQYFTEVLEPRWVNAEHTRIDCKVNFKHVKFEVLTPFCADPTDYMPYSKIIFDECVAGKWGEIAEYVPPPVEEPVVAAPDQPDVHGVQTL